MKRYRDPATGNMVDVDESNEGQIAALEALGYVVWDAAAIKAKLAATEQATAEAAQKLADAQKEMAERYPGAAAEEQARMQRAPRGGQPQAKNVVAEGTVEPVDPNNPPKPGTVVAEGTVEPQPRVPRKN